MTMIAFNSFYATMLIREYQSSMTDNKRFRFDTNSGKWYFLRYSLASGISVLTNQSPEDGIAIAGIRGLPLCLWIKASVDVQATESIQKLP